MADTHDFEQKRLRKNGLFLLSLAGIGTPRPGSFSAVLGGLAIGTEKRSPPKRDIWSLATRPVATC